MTKEQEQQIIDKVLAGDTEAFEELLLAHQTNVYNLALKMTGNQTDAEDVTQEAFFKAFRLLKGFRGDSRFSVWLYRITYNQCLDFLRKRKRTQAISLSQSDDEGDDFALEIPDVRELPENTAIRRELGNAINKSINELNQNYREIIVMREIADMSYSDIANTLNINEGTVKSRLSRARKSLANLLVGKEYGTYPSDNRQNDTGSIIPDRPPEGRFGN